MVQMCFWLRAAGKNKFYLCPVQLQQILLKQEVYSKQQLSINAQMSYSAGGGCTKT